MYTEKMISDVPGCLLLCFDIDMISNRALQGSACPARLEWQREADLQSPGQGEAECQQVLCQLLPAQPQGWQKGQQHPARRGEC